MGEDSVVVDSMAEEVGHQRMIEDKMPGDFGTAVGWIAVLCIHIRKSRGIGRMAQSLL